MTIEMRRYFKRVEKERIHRNMCYKD